MLELEKTAGEMIEEIYLATVCRIPSEEELQACLKIIEESSSPKEGYEDLMWALINSKDFLYVK